jgi:hypothetical protein
MEPPLGGGTFLSVAYNAHPFPLLECAFSQCSQLGVTLLELFYSFCSATFLGSYRSGWAPMAHCSHPFSHGNLPFMSG